MSTFARVLIHPTQFPDRVRKDLLECLGTRRFNHKFLYDSVKQTQKWLELHESYSPSRTDPGCGAAYEGGFGAAAELMAGRPVHLAGLGCGGGRKDSRLLNLLRAGGCAVEYMPVDVSTSMVLAARQAALAAVPALGCAPLVCDLEGVENWRAMLDEAFCQNQPRQRQDSNVEEAPGEIASPTTGPAREREEPGYFRRSGFRRLVTYFGMIPNFEPEVAMPRVAETVREGEALLLSANLAPGEDYRAGVRQVLPLYDNALTRAWLLTALLDLGVEPGDGSVQFQVEENPDAGGLRRIAAYYHFSGDRSIQVDQKSFKFAAGDKIRLFFSYRHTADQVVNRLARHGLKELGRWIPPSGEEGVFLFGREV